MESRDVLMPSAHLVLGAEAQVMWLTLERRLGPLQRWRCRGWGPLGITTGQGEQDQEFHWGVTEFEMLVGQLNMNQLVSRKHQTVLELQKNQRWRHRSACPVEGKRAKLRRELGSMGEEEVLGGTSSITADGRVPRDRGGMAQAEGRQEAGIVYRESKAMQN